MNCLLIYYTGTYNTRYLTGLLKERLENAGVHTDVYEIDFLRPERLDLDKYDLFGLGYPIYGFNAPYAFLKFIRMQQFPAGKRVFIYKNSGETYHANNASSLSVVAKIRHDGALPENEYHFIMPYNIHFRFEDALIKEMLGINDMLLDILVKEVLEGIPNIRKYKTIHKLITRAVRIQYIGGDVNSFFYKVNDDKCSRCGLCMNSCPAGNIRLEKGRIRFGHTCLMCMRCSFFCPNDAITIGLLEGWHVNGKYDFDRIKNLPEGKPVITDSTEGFFKCYVETYSDIRKRHAELFSE